MTTQSIIEEPAPARYGRLNGTLHGPALAVFAGLVAIHWVEHLVQAWQVWVLHLPRPAARGALGFAFPWLVSSEWLHYFYAIAMLVGFWVLRPGFKGRARAWWTAALLIQAWHHVEHLLLLVQALSGAYLLGRAGPTSVAQLLFPRVELHLFYNAIVTIPMLVAIYLHRRPTAEERAGATCLCAPLPKAQPATTPAGA